MAIAYGRDPSAALLMRGQSDFATQATGNFVQLPGYSYTGGSRRPVEGETLLAQGRNPGEALLGFESWDGEWVAPVRARTFGWHLRQLLGAPVTTGAGPYTHVFTPGAISHATVGRGAGATHFADIGVTWNTMRLQLARSSETQRATFGLIGQREAKLLASVDPTPVVTASADDLRFFAYDAGLTLGGATVADIVDLDMTVSNGRTLDEQAISGDPWPLAVLEGDFEVTGSATFRFDGAARYDAARAATELKMVVAWANGANSLAIEIDKVVFSADAPRLTGAGVLQLSLPWRATRPTDGQPPLKATLINALASYADPA